ncbi:hypothetical protein L1049_001242 [Liquidambar formosana]|uniref:Uncharacterized protein n=1 Tax=Liquidambar formosana TaxID=63359 RepID=A0AAP0NC36_LIQFO
MGCINCHSPFLPLLSQNKHKQPQQQQQLKTSKLLWLSSNEPNRLLQRQNISSLVPLRTKAVPTSLVLGVTSPAKSGDISVFLQTSAVLLFMYWIANFVVPDIILKYFQLDKTSEEEKPNDNSPLEDKKASTPVSGTQRSQAKTRGFNSTKP